MIPQAVLDTCVLFPIYKRDLLFQLASDGLYHPKWTSMILEELRRTFQGKGPSLEAYAYNLDLMARHFPFAMIEGFEWLIPSLDLPDPDDCHVLAAAIHAQVKWIVTDNLKDFPTAYLTELEIEVLSADRFCAEIIAQYPEKGIQSWKKLVARKKRPPISEREYLEIYRFKVGLPLTSNVLEGLLA
ncbi:PIN domain-containing protein [Pontibacter sp. G13]|uniref:PIN domain-containing protein n=1 Tax=Pontibacter sp. G13 TaxID=3074898 RepID=UPI00288AFED1|nr:PIN domain-containing protein [Pontibacter sp. G13]WNJ17962.1 PIN domain-containing protein [Pontibacter sp. G13]